jgi:hypothetical protein
MLHVFFINIIKVEKDWIGCRSLRLNREKTRAKSPPIRDLSPYFSRESMQIVFGGIHNSGLAFTYICLSFFYTSILFLKKGNLNTQGIHSMQVNYGHQQEPTVFLFHFLNSTACCMSTIPASSYG